jgi:uncharacterized OsmC-like protein
MAAQDLAAALQRTESVLRRRPSMGLSEDAPSTACWVGGTRIVSSHPNGHQVLTDVPAELGGSGDQVSPGWLVRAGLASCTATCIVMVAASEGIELTALEVQATSRSDTRGLLGMASADGAPVNPGPQDMQMRVRISAHGVAPERLRALVEESQHTSPVLSALQDAVSVGLRIEVETD